MGRLRDGATNKRYFNLIICLSVFTIIKWENNSQAENPVQWRNSKNYVIKFDRSLYGFS